MLRVTFSPAPECVEVDCWNQAFQTPPCHQDGVVVVIVVIVVVVPALTKAARDIIETVILERFLCRGHKTKPGARS